MASYAGITRLAEQTKDAQVYPLYTPELRAAMQRETERLIDAVLWEGDGTFKTLMTALYSFINSILAKLYRVADHGNGDALVKTTLRS